MLSISLLLALLTFISPSTACNRVVTFDAPGDIKRFTPGLYYRSYSSYYATRKQSICIRTTPNLECTDVTVTYKIGNNNNYDSSRAVQFEYRPRGLSTALSWSCKSDGSCKRYTLADCKEDFPLSSPAQNVWKFSDGDNRLNAWGSRRMSRCYQGDGSYIWGMATVIFKAKCTSKPTKKPTTSPTWMPSKATDMPTTRGPTEATNSPSNTPTEGTEMPTSTLAPSITPTDTTNMPTSKTSHPTYAPTDKPTKSPIKPRESDSAVYSDEAKFTKDGSLVTEKISGGAVVGIVFIVLASLVCLAIVMYVCGRRFCEFHQWLVQDSKIVVENPLVTSKKVQKGMNSLVRAASNSMRGSDAFEAGY